MPAEPRPAEPRPAEPRPAEPRPAKTHEDGVDALVRGAVAQWPDIDPEVEGILVRLHRADRYLTKAASVTLARFGLTHEAFKVLLTLHEGPLSHGSLCRELLVSSGVMTNRLDKLQGAGLLIRKPDPADRRGVLLELTAAGHECLADYAAAGGKRERELLAVLTPTEKSRLNELLRTLVAGLESELGPPPRHPQRATEVPE